MEYHGIAIWSPTQQEKIADFMVCKESSSSSDIDDIISSLEKAISDLKLFKDRHPNLNIDSNAYTLYR
jgi:hypothetical protein